jgi:DNA-binding response OmpR family regulator
LEDLTVAKILIVDDEKSVRDLYAEELGGEGYDVITAGEGREVSELISSEQPSALVLDIRMEDCDGLDLLQEVRNAHPDLPIILNTAYDSYREDVKSTAADYYVVKSFDLSELKVRLSAVVKEKRNRKHPL